MTLQADLGDIAGPVAGHCDKASGNLFMLVEGLAFYL